MFILYVDESGDYGLPQKGSPTRYLVLSGLVVHELRWRQYLDSLIAFRQQLRTWFGLKLREEIHASHLITNPGQLARIKRNNRLQILRRYANHIATLSDFNVINVVVDKMRRSATDDVFDMAWRALIQRFENTISNRNFPGPTNPDERGLVFPDRTDDKKLTALIRRMRHFNPVPNQPHHGIGYRNLVLRAIIEDPSFRDSAHSYFVQSVDLVAYLLFQKLNPNGYFRKKGARNLFDSLDPILCKVASPGCQWGKGIVWL